MPASPQARLNLSYAFLQFFSILGSVAGGVLTVWILIRLTLEPRNPALGFGFMGVVFGALPLFCLSIFGLFFARVHANTKTDEYSIYNRVGMVTPFLVSIGLSLLLVGIGLLFAIPMGLIYYYSYRLNKGKRPRNVRRQVLLGLLTNVIFIALPFCILLVFELFY